MRIMAIIIIFWEGGFQSCLLFSHYLFHYFVPYSKFGPENNLMVILMNTIMGQIIELWKPLLGSFKVPIIYTIMMFIIYLILF